MAARSIVHAWQNLTSKIVLFTSDLKQCPLGVLPKASYLFLAAPAILVMFGLKQMCVCVWGGGGGVKHCLMGTEKYYGSKCSVLAMNTTRLVGTEPTNSHYGIGCHPTCQVLLTGPYIVGKSKYRLSYDATYLYMSIL